MATTSPPTPDADPSTMAGGGASLTLEELIEHFVASKRSLASISHVWQANEIVATAKTQIEDIATINAKSGFLRKSIERQLVTLQSIKGGLDEVGRDVHADFKVRYSGLIW